MHHTFPVRSSFSTDAALALRRAAAVAALGLAAAAHADPFADAVVSYVPGVGVGPSAADPAAALGSPTRFTAPGSNFGGAVTTFQAAFGAGELVTVGEGGQLTVRFDEPITDDPSNPFGIDLLVFGNSFYGLNADNTAGSLFGEGGRIEVSADGITFIEVPGVAADGAFPTLGYRDVTEPFPSEAGAVPTDFTRPVDPSFDPMGLTTAQIAAAYAGSGGGAGVDIGSVGLTSVSFVRITDDNPLGSGTTPEIDGFADVAAVPEPASAAVLLAVLGGVLLRRRRASLKDEV